MKSVVITKKKMFESSDSTFHYASDPDPALILNSGSVGQPRGNGDSFLMFELIDKHIEYSIISIDVNLEKHIAAIEASSMSASSKSKLISYFEGS